MAGAPGFEPGIAGPKPAALPLGYAPSAALILFRALVVLALGEEVDERDDGDDRDRDDGGRLRQEPHDRNEHAGSLRRGEDPRQVPRRARLVVASNERPEADRDRSKHVDQQVRDHPDENQEALGDRDPERDLDPVLTEGNARARHY